MCALAQAYQAERPNVEASDLTGLVIRALGVIVGKMVKDERDHVANVAVCANVAVLSERRFITTETITATAQALIESQELDFDSAYVTSRRIGHVLKKMRLESARPGRSTKRGWMISFEEVIRWAGSYGLNAPIITGIDPATLPKNGDNGTNGDNGDIPTPNPKLNLRQGIL